MKRPRLVLAIIIGILLTHGATTRAIGVNCDEEYAQNKKKAEQDFETCKTFGGFGFPQNCYIWYSWDIYDANVEWAACKVLETN